jgi:hypothetical protein
MVATFNEAGQFEGTGLEKWGVDKVTAMNSVFLNTALTSCNKRKIEYAWGGNEAFKTTTYVTDWVSDICMVRDTACAVTWCCNLLCSRWQHLYRAHVHVCTNTPEPASFTLSH